MPTPAEGLQNAIGFLSGVAGRAQNGVSAVLALDLYGVLMDLSRAAAALSNGTSQTPPVQPAAATGPAVPQAIATAFQQYATTMQQQVQGRVDQSLADMEARLQAMLKQAQSPQGAQAPATPPAPG